MTESVPVTAYIGLGSNQANPVDQLLTARQALAQTVGIREMAFSSLYRSEPLASAVIQPDYINAVMALQTTLAAPALMTELHGIEARQGRVRTDERWAPRTLDLDLLLYGEAVIHNEHLVVPHYGLHQRAFVLYPLYELAPDLVIPGQGCLADLMQQCPRGRLTRLSA